MLKRMLAFGLTLALALSLCGAAMAEGGITLTVWSFTNEIRNMIEKYYMPSHPDVHFDFNIIPTDGNQYQDKLDGLLNGGVEAPDILTLEAAFVKRYVNSGVTADLTDVGFTEAELAQAFPVMREIGQDSAGRQKGLSWQSTPGALFYRASLAEKYLGVKNPEEFQKKVANWNLFMDAARQVKAASQGNCRIITGTGDLWNVFQYQRSTGWVRDGRVQLDNKLLNYEELCRSMMAEGLTWDEGSWSNPWYEGMRGERETLCYFLPTWGLHYVLKPGCVVGGFTVNNQDPEYTEEKLAALSAANGGTYGDWRMVSGPVAYSWGGTWIAAGAQAVAAADGARKAAIKDVIAFFSLDVDFLKQYARDSGDFVGSSAAVEAILAEGGTPNPFLGGQDHYALFAEAARLANGKLMTEYDDPMQNLFDEYVTGPYTHGEADLNTAIENFKAAVRREFPELSTDDIRIQAFSLTLGAYTELFSMGEQDRYFVMPVGASAQMRQYLLQEGAGVEPLLVGLDNGLSASLDILTAVQPGVHRFMTSVMRDGVELEGTRVIGKALVYDPAAVIALPANTKVLEPAVMTNTDARFVIVPANVQRIESGCFSNCPNLMAVVLLCDLDAVQIAPDAFDTDNVLFLCADGQIPANVGAELTGRTAFFGF